MLDIPQLIQPLFIAAGWSPVQHSSHQREELGSAHARASDILKQFGGLQVGQSGPGTEQAASDIHFYSSPRPDVSAIMSPWASTIGPSAAFATAHNDHMILFVNHAGEYFAFTDPDECLYKLDGSFGEAMQKLLWGYKYGAPLARHA